jgi:hypothetical protein
MAISRRRSRGSCLFSHYQELLFAALTGVEERDDRGDRSQGGEGNGVSRDACERLGRALGRWH